MKRILIIILIVIGLLSCQSKESHYKDVKIQQLTTKVDSLEIENQTLNLEVWSQYELIYTQDTTIMGLQKQLKK